MACVPPPKGPLATDCHQKAPIPWTHAPIHAASFALRQGPGCLAKTLESRRLLAQYFSNLIKDGIEVGEFHPTVSPQDAALALVGFMNGMGLIWVQDPEHFSIKDRAESLVDLFLSSIGTGVQ